MNGRDKGHQRWPLDPPGVVLVVLGFLWVSGLGERAFRQPLDRSGDPPR